MSLTEESSVWEGCLLYYGEWLSMGILVAVPSVLSPEPPTPESPQVFPVYSAFPLRELRVSGSKWNFVRWPFKRLSASPAISPFADRNQAAFYSWMLFGFLSGYGAISWGAQLVVSFNSILLRGNPPAAEYLELQLPPVGAQPALLCFRTPYQSLCGEAVSSVCPWLFGFSPASVQLVIQDDFFYNLVVIPDCSLREVNVHFTYSSTILHQSIKLLLTMKNISFILKEKIKWTFWSTQYPLT